MVSLTLKANFNKSQLETDDLCLGYKEITLLFNVGPYPGGGNCIIVNADSELIVINSNDLIHDLPAYRMRDS